jgi:uncharacterized membrane protein YeaQ/YmgE (transglycosylase-associated protein family)
VEKGGWLDQILLAILGFLNQSWLSITVALVGGAVVAYLARVSPKNDWEYLKEGPGKVLSAAFFLLAAVRSAPRLVIPETRFVCDRVTGEFGIPVSANCRTVTEGTVGVVYDYTLGDMLYDFFFSMVQEVVFGLIGAAVGIIVATVVRRSRRA